MGGELVPVSQLRNCCVEGRHFEILDSGERSLGVGLMFASNQYEEKDEMIDTLNQAPMLGKIVHGPITRADVV